MNAPKLRFAEFSEPWKKVEFGDLFAEKTIKTGELGKFPLYSLTVEKGVTPKSERYTRDFLVKKEDNYKLVDPSDFVSNPMNMTIGALALYQGKKSITVSGYYNVFTNISDFKDTFIETYLKTSRMINIYRSIATGSLIEKQRVHYSQFILLKEFFPSIKEANKISGFLELINRRIEQQQEKVEACRAYKKGMMQKLFSRELRFKDEDGQEFPEWDERFIEEIADVSTGNKDTQDKVDGGRYPFYVRSNTIESIESYSFDGEAILTAGDGAGVGKVFHYVNGEFDFHQRVYKISNFHGCIGRFLYYYFSENFLREAMKYNAKTSVDSVRREMITKMLVPLPSLEEQKKIAKVLSVIEMKVEKEEMKFDCLMEQKKGLMQQMFI